MPNPTLAQMGFLDEDTQQETVYDIEDSEARSDISALENKIGSANGIAELDGNGLVPASQLPSYVDDVLEGTAQNVTETAAGTFAATGFILKGELLPCTPEDGKTYVDTTSNIQYRWTGSGTNFVSMGSNLTLGETANTAYAGNKGKANADAIAAMKDGSSIDSFGDVETALAGKVDKVQGKGLSTNDYNNTAKGVVDTAQDNIKANTKLIKDTVGWSGKNKLKNTATTNTINGITFTVNKDDSIKANGTATGRASINIATTSDRNNGLPEGEYKMPNIPTGFAGVNLLYLNGNTETSIKTLTSANNKFSITSETANKPLRVEAVIVSGTTVNDIMLYPMFCDADILDDAYEPYHESIEAMYEEEIFGINLIPFPYNANTQDLDVTVTVDNDGVITVNGTQNSNIGQYYLSSRFTYDFKLPAGSYTVTGGTSDCYINVSTNNVTGDSSQGSKFLGSDTGSGFNFTLDKLRDMQVILAIKSGTYSNKKIYPMLRKAGIEDSAYRPYNAQAIQNQLNAQAVLGAKNWLLNKATSQTTGDIVWTANANKTITANGSAGDADRSIIILNRNSDNFSIPSGTYKLSGNPSNDTTLLLQATRSGQLTELGRVNTANGEIEVTIQSTDILQCVLFVSSNKTVNNVVFKPMLRLASDPDDTYVPYAMTNRELTEKVQGIIDAATNAADFAAFKTAIVAL